jgi:beta-1,2-mannobiose phosphorylase / 1,2-beta-oligomannan phosphorylase
MTKIAKLTRYKDNPILMPRPYNAFDTVGAFNPGAVMDDDGRIHILYRGAGCMPKHPGCDFHVATIGHAVTEDGFNIIERSEHPVIDLLGEDKMIFGITGVEDPRITRIGDTYYIVYAITSDCWDRLALASTKDFKTYKKHGLIVKDIEQRTGGLFPEKINGKFILMHRPIPNIWISESSDLVHWENPKMILTNEVLPWCEIKLGICAPPIRTKKAWAVIFHGKDRHFAYRLGIFWLDLEDPRKVLKVQAEPILEPETPYETRKGMTGNCVYACGAVVKNGTVFVYYGAGDSYGCVATMPQEMLELPD